MQVYIYLSFSCNFPGERLSGGGADEPPEHLLFYIPTIYVCICVIILAKMYSLVLQETQTKGKENR